MTTGTRARPRPPRRAPASRPTRRFPVLPVTLAAIVVLGLAAVALSRGGGDGADETAPVAVTGTALPVLGDGPDPAVGARAPVVTGTTLGGDELRLGGGGRPAIVVFLAHWCPHCQAEVPIVQSWVDAGRLPDGVDLVSVASGTNRARPNYPPSAWLEREGWTAPVVLDDAEGTAAAAYGLGGFPYFVVLDEEGDVVARRSGRVPEAELDALAAAVDPGP